MDFVKKYGFLILAILALLSKLIWPDPDSGFQLSTFLAALFLALWISVMLIFSVKDWLSEETEKDNDSQKVSRWSKMNYLHRASTIWLGGLIISILVLSFTSFTSDFHVIWKSATIAVVMILVACVFAIQYWNRTFKDAVEDEKRKNPYNRMFFGNVRLLSIILLAVGLTGAFLLLFSTDDKNHSYEAMGLVVIVIWAVIFLRFFIWAVYHYNINFGLTDKDWIRVFNAREKKANGELFDDEDLKAPKHNPYRSQTFGLPPGTVRGMIAFTLLFGAITMLIVSMGINGSIEQDSFFWDHFEFYKTAFLMMIAFYFGDRSLKYLQKRWPSVQQGKLKKTKAGGGADQPDDEVGEDDAEFSADNDLEQSFTSTPRGFSPSAMKDILSNAESGQIDQATAESNVLIKKEYRHVGDVEFERKLNQDAIKLAAKESDILPAVMRAIIAIESSGHGFLDDGRPKILFEGHKFWKWLKKRNLKPEDYAVEHPDIVYPSWTRKYYKGGKLEYDRFNRAFAIHKEAAIYSTSWGLFQILGENFESRGYCNDRVFETTEAYNKDLSDYEAVIKDLKTENDPAVISQLREKEDKLESSLYKYPPLGEFPDDFLEMQSKSEYYHLLDFIEFIKSKFVKYPGDEETPGTKGFLIDFIKGSDDTTFNWKAFAYGYNGSGFKEHHYHIRLEKAYERYK